MQNIRNFCIISHVNHGKSTLADRFLEITNTIPKEKMKPQYLNLMDLEREKGITIKMQPVRMSYILNSKSYILNLIDTPGHVDFSYEVSRSLAAVEGAILLVDATRGIQAQTIANLELAKKQNLVIIPALNKIDSPQARTEEAKEELAYLLNIQKEEIFSVSAKNGTNVEQVLSAVIEKIPGPRGDSNKPFRALIFGSQYDSFQGVIAYVRVIDGEIRAGEKINLLQAKALGDVKEVGYFKPEFKKSDKLFSGEIGYIATGIKEPGKVRVGDTISKIIEAEPLPGYEEPKPMVFASLYPENPADFELLKDALEKLKLKDASLTFELESQETLGRGFRCGFLGSLHAEIVSERLLREFGLTLVISRPSVVYKIINQQNKEILIFSPSDWPLSTEIKEIQEPWVELEVITPQEYMGQVMELIKKLKGNFVKSDYFVSEKTVFVYEVPLREIIVGFYDSLKEVSRGFASMNYKVLGYRPGDLVKMEILVAGKKEEAFSKIVQKDDAFDEGKKIVQKLKEILPAQLYAVALQASISGKIIARENIGAKRRDVIAPLYGGDYTRKRKLLERQKEGKKDLKEKGDIRIPQKVFLEMFQS
ncbi:MAG: translation elongation factor 4 [Candidatus Pacebacteria bacterium]|nr:translation elongation factor 4 [Candidatus Paceibacterota bacterium]